MNVQQAYNNWAAIYDTNNNKTRDLEAVALREILAPVNFSSCIEIGCGTGKNTVWLATKTQRLLSVDLSEEMLAKAIQKVTAPHVKFVQADITTAWNFTNEKFELATFSLVLEHIENLDDIFKKLAAVIESGGHLYIGELHPFKQYAGTKARFESENGTQVVTCFNHNLSDFIQPALQHGFTVVNIKEYFDADGEHELPRILAILLRKN